MDIKEAESRLETARYNLNGCLAHLHRTIDARQEGERSRGDNKLYYRLKRTLGDDYMKQLRENNDSAHKEYDRAREELDKAEADYNKALEKILGND